jgi:hypothetical protein
MIVIRAKQRHVSFIFGTIKNRTFTITFEGKHRTSFSLFIPPLENVIDPATGPAVTG